MIAQPSGSINDKKIIDYADENKFHCIQKIGYLNIEKK